MACYGSLTEDFVSHLSANAKKEAFLVPGTPPRKERILNLDL